MKKSPVTCPAPAASVLIDVQSAKVTIGPMPALPPEDAIVAMLNVLFASHKGTVDFSARTVAGFGELRNMLHFDGRAVLKLPAKVLELLTERDWSATVTAAFGDGHPWHPTLLPLLSVSFDMSPEFTKGEDGWKWRPSAARVRKVARAVDEFSVAPAVVIDALATQTAIWPLMDPIQPDGRAASLLERLAVRLGGQLPADPFTALIPVPGFIVRNVGNMCPLPVVTITRLVPNARTTIEALEAALAPPATETGRAKGDRA